LSTARKDPELAEGVGGLATSSAVSEGANAETNPVSTLRHEETQISPGTHSVQPAPERSARPDEFSEAAAIPRNSLECPLDELRAAFREVLEARTTVVIDYLTLENEVLRVCDARQVLVNRLLNTTASVEKRASELLAKKSNIVAKEWAASEVAVLEAERLALEERTRAARVIEAKSEDNPDFNTEAVSSNLPKASIASCRPDYRVTSIVGSAGKARANILGPNGDSYSVAAGDALPFGVKILAVGQGLVTIEYDGGRDVLAFLPDETRASIELSEEGFITLPLAPKSVVGGN
jgi:hypothetical protein